MKEKAFYQKLHNLSQILDSKGIEVHIDKAFFKPERLNALFYNADTEAPIWFTKGNLVLKAVCAMDDETLMMEAQTDDELALENVDSETWFHVFCGTAEEYSYYKNDYTEDEDKIITSLEKMLDSEWIISHFEAAENNML